MDMNIDTQAVSAFCRDGLVWADNIEKLSYFMKRRMESVADDFYDVNYERMNNSVGRLSDALDGIQNNLNEIRLFAGKLLEIVSEYEKLKS